MTQEDYIFQKSATSYDQTLPPSKAAMEMGEGTGWMGARLQVQPGENICVVS